MDKVGPLCIANITLSCINQLAWITHSQDSGFSQLDMHDFNIQIRPGEANACTYIICAKYLWTGQRPMVLDFCISFRLLFFFFTIRTYWNPWYNIFRIQTAQELGKL